MIQVTIKTGNEKGVYIVSEQCLQTMTLILFDERNGKRFYNIQERDGRYFATFDKRLP